MALGLSDKTTTSSPPSFAPAADFLFAAEGGAGAAGDDDDDDEEEEEEELDWPSFGHKDKLCSVGVAPAAHKKPVAVPHMWHLFAFSVRMMVQAGQARQTLLGERAARALGLPASSPVGAADDEPPSLPAAVSKALAGGGDDFDARGEPEASPEALARNEKPASSLGLLLVAAPRKAPTPALAPPPPPPEDKPKKGFALRGSACPVSSARAHLWCAVVMAFLSATWPRCVMGVLHTGHSAGEAIFVMLKVQVGQARGSR